MKTMWIVCVAVFLSSAGFAAQTFPGASDELNKSRQELTQLLTKYRDQHPLVVTKREQIANLEKVLELQQLLKAREELNELLTKYTEQHPLVVAKHEQIARLEKTIAPQKRAQESSQPAPTMETVRELQKAIQELNELLTTYTGAHPLVVAKLQQIDALEKSLKSN